MSETAKHLIEVNLDETEPAIALDDREDTWRHAAVADAPDPAALGLLEQRFAREGRWHEWIDFQLERADHVADRAERTAALLRVATLLADNVGDPRAAADVYEFVRREEPANDVAVRRLESIYESLGDWEPLVAMLLDLVDETRNDAERLRLLRRIVTIYERELHQVPAAFTVMLAAFREDVTSDDSWNDLVRLGVAAGAVDELLDECDEVAAQLADTHSGRACDLWVRLGRECEQQLERPERAIPFVRQALAVDTRHRGGRAALAALYRSSEQWHELVELSEQLAADEADPQRAAHYLVEVADLMEHQLEQPTRAVSAYRGALDRDPLCAPAISGLEWLYRRLGMSDDLAELYHGLAKEHEHLRTGDGAATAMYLAMLDIDPSESRALEALARLYQEAQQWERAIAMLARLADVHGEVSVRVELHRRVATIQSEHLGDEGRAENELRVALELDPSHGPAFEDLARLRHRSGDGKAEAEMLVSAATAASNDARRVRLLCGAARIFTHEHDAERAHESFEAAFALDPECVCAAEGLADGYAERRRWAELEPVIGLLVRKAVENGVSSRELRDLHVRAASCARELGKCRAALKHYDAAIALDAARPPVLLDRAAVLYEMRLWDRADAAYRELRARYGDTLGPEELIRVGCCLGSIAHVRGQRDKALAELRQVLEVDPHHSETLKVVIDIQRALGNWKAVVSATRALVVRAPDRERPQLQREIGLILRERLDAPREAIEVYRELLASVPSDHRILQSLVELYVCARDWDNALEIIEKFSHVEANRYRKGKLYQTAGTICHQELGDGGRAVDYFDAALDCYFRGESEISHSQRLSCLRAFALIDEVLTEAHDFCGQARAYERMIGRLEPSDNLRPRLLHSLGEIYRTRLRQPQRAIAAFEAAAELEPPSSERAAILSELYAQAGPAAADKAAAQYTRLLERDPHDVDSYRALRRIFIDVGEYDRAWSACGALVVLGRATRDERSFYEEYRPRTLPRATHSLSDDLWRQLPHPAEDRYLTAVLGAVARPAALLGAHRHKEVGLDRRERRELAGDQLHFSQILGYSAYVLGVELPEVFLQPDQRGEILVSNTAHKGQLVPSLIARQDVLQGCSAREIAFTGARALALLRPEYYLRLALQTKTELRAALLSAIVLVRRDFAMAPDDRALVAGYLPSLEKRLTFAELQWLARVVQRFLERSGSLDLAQWSNAVDFTAHRAGLLAAGDLPVAAARIRCEPQSMGEPSARDKLGQLLLFAVSEQHHAARRHLGWALE